MTQQQTFTLKAQKRKIIGNKLQNLRDNGLIPAVLYGHKIANLNLAIDEIELQKLLNKISESELVDLVVDQDAPIKVLIQDIAHDPLKGTINHLDFYQVNMKEKIKTAIELNFINESPAVKDFGGVLVKTLDTIEVECLPGDLISHFDIDLSLLKGIGSIIRAKDLIMPSSLTLLTDLETVIVLAEEPKKEVALVPETVTTGETTNTPKATAESKTEEVKDNKK
ncbi:MAG TPA: 50S ribosomal protein L25 [bacterium]|nr:50S ribosomal protein L25 [bacterium]